MIRGFKNIYIKNNIFEKALSLKFCSTSSKLCSSKNDNESPLKKLLNDSSSFQDVTHEYKQQWTTLPYPQGTKIKKQDDFPAKEKVDPKDASIILFPGQGSQYVGMTKELMKYPMAKDLFELANYILGYNLLKLCLEGPKDKLDQTKYSQPAVVVSSLAALEKLKEERPNAIINCAATAGFSVGEITALIFAGAIGFERGLQLVKIRGEAMQLASEAYKGGMATVFYGPDTKFTLGCVKAREWALNKGDPIPECKVANYLYPHCKVIAGSESALDFLEKSASTFNIRKVKRLPVSGAFHTNLMEPAVEVFQKALRKSEINDPVITVYSNVDGKPYRDANHIRRQLPKQIVKPVKWEQLLHAIYERAPGVHFPRTFEVGPGTSLKAIFKQVNAKAAAECYSIEA